MAARLVFLNPGAWILDRIRSGDEGALAELYRTSRRQVTAFVTRNGGNDDDAEDMLQEAVVVVWERVRSGRLELTARIETFVVGIVKNLWMRRRARMRRESVFEPDVGDPPDGSPAALDELIENEQALAVRDALETLGDPCRALLLMFYWEELAMEEIAQRLGFANAETAKSKKYQCKKALEGLLKETMTRGD